MLLQTIRGFALNVVAGASMFGVTLLSATAQAEVTWNIVGAVTGEPSLIGAVTTPDVPVSTCSNAPAICGVSGTLTFPAGSLGGPGVTIDFATDVDTVAISIAGPPPSWNQFTFAFTKNGYSCNGVDELQVLCQFDGGTAASFDLELTPPSVAIGNGNVIITSELWVAGKPVEAVSPVADTSCSVAECNAEGVTTLTCGATQVEIQCAQTPTPPITYAIGDAGPAGGVVFYVTFDGRHGLEAAPVDQASAQWGCFTVPITGADGLTFGTGARNTADIIAGCTTANIAADIADDYSLGGFDDWFLPSKDELNELYRNSFIVGGFASDYYWSSSEANDVSACYQDFLFGSQSVNNKDTTIRVRAVRAF